MQQHALVLGADIEQHTGLIGVTPFHVSRSKMTAALTGRQCVDGGLWT